ncbi:glycosyltransferase N-terminal domain-containing protein [Candidatus Endomicrobiellum trichonymphae]|uniref:glycosyltransferase N-terminal domain-containing protein n=1 Tax=Endomicrobium trichonymphae TaxID=1408204 RepID=UPI0003216FAC
MDGFEGKYYIVLTSTTKSGREYAQKLPKVDFVALLPLDIYLFMRRALILSSRIYWCLLKLNCGNYALYCCAQKYKSCYN